MATLVYDKKGEEFKVIHAIDVKDWLEAGHTLEKPKVAQKPVSKTAEKKG